MLALQTARYEMPVFVKRYICGWEQWIVRPETLRP